jgi:hypothetical protein
MRRTHGLVTRERLDAAMATVEGEAPVRRSFSRLRTEAPVPELVEGEEATRPSRPAMIEE